MLLLVAGLQTSWGFALLGPLANLTDNWQTPDIAYGYAYEDFGFPGGPVYLGDIGGPKAFNQGYRRNVPVIYYACDVNFWTFFKDRGVAEVDKAFAIMNSLTNADQMDLSQYPLESQHGNPTATATYLTDLKSVTLHLLVEQMGLAQPERYTWTLHNRNAPPGCPLTTWYLVVQRNIDATSPPNQLNQLVYSAYVNDVLYTYQIIEFCAPPDPLAYTLNFSVDPLADQYNAVAANNGDFFGGLQVGGFYTGLTRDDVAGLKYLLTTNNIQTESAPNGSLLFSVVTNFSAPQSLFPVSLNSNSVTGYGTFDYGTFLQAATTNSPALMQSNYPGLVVSSSQNYWILATNITVTAIYVSPAGSPVGSPPILVLKTNRSYFPRQMYVTKFANVITNYYFPNTKALRQTVKTGPQAGAPYGSPSVSVTNTVKVTLTNAPSGSFYILPMFGPNFCPLDILYTLQTNVTYMTNLLTGASTNILTGSTNSTATNSPGSYSYSQSLITWYTNYTYVTLPVSCSYTNGTGLYQGIGKVQFIRHDFDSLLSQYWEPVTNSYNMVAVDPKSGRLVTRHFDRVVTAPEILLTATDQGEGNTFNGTVMRDISFDQSQVPLGQAGPGVIIPTTTFDYNEIGNAYRNGFEANPYLTSFILSSNVTGYVDETMQMPVAAWASFDDSTNDPVIYPNTTTFANLANQILIPISPATLANGINGVAYGPVQFTVTTTRLTLPFTWSATGLPPGLTVDASGVLSGTPIQQAPSLLTYDFTLTLTDAQQNSVQWNYPLIIQ
jgi:hypothetical protein